jgi:hypothetical protein
MTRICALALAAVFLGATLAASADESQSPTTVADVRCVVVGLISANYDSNGAALLTFYFLGRIDDREPPSFDLSQAVLAQINVMSAADLSAEGRRCGKELEGRALYMADVAQKLKDQTAPKK